MASATANFLMCSGVVFLVMDPDRRRPIDNLSLTIDLLLDCVRDRQLANPLVLFEAMFPALLWRVGRLRGERQESLVTVQRY